MVPPIDDVRYAALCEIGTHPTPALPPGHYTGTGIGIIGGLMQEVGVLVAMNELAYAVGMSVPVCRLVKATTEIRLELRDRCADLFAVVGGVTALNYEEGLRELHRRRSEGA